MVIIILNLLVLGLNLANAQKLIIDYTKENVNTVKYNAVPTKVLFWTKYQATEPNYMFEGKLRGHGWHEPIDNDFIHHIRKLNIEVYIDYITIAKNGFYTSNKGYETCSLGQLSKIFYDKMINKQINNHFKDTNSNKFYVSSIPLALNPPIGRFAILTTHIPFIEKYKFSGTNIYNIKGIIDDPLLYTIQIEGMASGIRRYIYNQKNIIEKIYKKRVYEFVASNSEQIILMLNGKRMHWVDISILGDYYLNKNKISTSKIQVLDFSHVHPKDFTDNELRLDFYTCRSENLDKIKKAIKIINERTKLIRTNLEYWQTILKDYAKNFDVPYTPPEEFYYTRETFKRKEEIDRGVFDYKHKF